MKKMVVCVVMFFILIAGGAKQRFSLLDYFDGEYYAYTETPASNDYINLGFCYMNKGKVENKKLIGESVKIYNFEPINAIKTLNAQIVKVENLEGVQVLYAFSSRIKMHVNLEGEKANLQIACYDNYSIVGWPLILGSY